MKADEFDSIIFDCDGVLIDVTKSYDTTINRTISYVLKEIAGITVDTPLTNELLLKFKSTGGFNDEIDITYAGILWFIAAKKLNKDPTELILDVINNADDSGITYIENFLNKIDVDVSDVIVPVLSKKFSADFIPLSSALSITSKMSSVGFLFNFLAAI